MTAILAASAGRRAWVAADSVTTVGDHAYPSPTPKIWRPVPGVVVGVAGSGGAHLALWRDWRPEDAPPEGGELAWAVRETRRLEAILGPWKGEGEEGSDADVLLAVGGALFSYGPGDGLDRLPGYGAIGSAAPVALGALAVLSRVSARARVLRALEACYTHGAGIGGPVVLLRT